MTVSTVVYATAQTDYEAAKKAFEAKNYQEALNLYESAINANSKYTEAYYGKGKTLLELQKYDDAVNAFTQVVTLDSKNADGYTGRAAAYGAEQKWDEALVDLNKALRRQNILDLTWEQIDLVGRVIEITENKSNKHILKPINDTLYEYFTSIPLEKRSGYVFINYYTGKKCKEIKRAWKTAKEKSEYYRF